LAGEAGAGERGEQEVSRAIPREHPPRPGGSVGRRGETQHEPPGERVAEARKRTAPVLLPREGGATLTCHFLSPGDQTRTAPTARYLVREGAEGSVIA